MNAIFTAQFLLIGAVQTTLVKCGPKMDEFFNNFFILFLEVYEMGALINFPISF